MDKRTCMLKRKNKARMTLIKIAKDEAGILTDSEKARRYLYKRKVK